MTNKFKIRLARYEAEEFIKRAQEVEDLIEKDKYALITGTKKTAALKRQSMELTRKLAEMRKP